MEARLHLLWLGAFVSSWLNGRFKVQFYSERIADLPSIVSEPADYARAAEPAGNARRAGQGKPGLIDGLIAAIALRTGAMVATQNTKDFNAMGCPCANQIEALTCPPSA